MMLALIAAATFACTPIRIADGDTFTCAGGQRVRLAAIDAPEMPGHCRPGRQCAPGDPAASRVALARMVQGRTLQCEATGRSYDRTVARCTAGGIDVGCAQVRAGQAVEVRRYGRACPIR